MTDSALSQSRIHSIKFVHTDFQIRAPELTGFCQLACEGPSVSWITICEAGIQENTYCVHEAC